MCLPSRYKAPSLIPSTIKHNAQVIIFIPSSKLISQLRNEALIVTQETLTIVHKSQTTPGNNTNAHRSQASIPKSQWGSFPGNW